MRKLLLPHEILFDEIQITMLAIAKELPHTQAVLRFAKGLPTCITHHDPVEKLTTLRKSTKELASPLKQLMHHIAKFSPFKPIEKALIALNKSYLNIPPIDSELHLLILGTDIFENQELVEKFLRFTNSLELLQTDALRLQKAVLNEFLSHITLTLDRIPSH